MLLMMAQPGLSVGIGYNSECRLDSECRAEIEDVPDVCCALLIYEANGANIKKRECLARSIM